MADACLTVRDLRHILAFYPDDMPVVVDGYEGGNETLIPGNVYPALVGPHCDGYFGNCEIRSDGTPHLVLSRDRIPIDEGWNSEDGEHRYVLPVLHSVKKD